MIPWAFGVLMVLAAAGAGGVPALITAVLALAAVVAGVFHRSAAVVAVLATVAVLALSEVPPLFAAVSGLCAAAYLVLSYGAGAGVVVMTVPTVVGMAGFTVVAVAAAMLPWRLSWVPLLAPAAVVAIVAMTGAGLSPKDPVRYE